MSFSVKNAHGDDDEFVANSEINVTPFVDVMLVLLIVFMVTAPMLAKGVKIDLPRANAAATLPMTSMPVVVSLKDDNTLYFNETQITPDQLDPMMRKEVAANKDVVTHIRAAANVPYGRVLDAVATLSAAGAQRISFIARSDSGTPAPVVQPAP